MSESLSRRGFFAAGLAVTAAASIKPAALAGGAAPTLAAASAAPLAASAPGMIWLAANENPYGPSPLARAALSTAADGACRYPMGVATQLIDKLAAREGVDRERIVLGAGSAELLSTLALGYGGRGALVCAWPTFEQLPGYAERRGTEIRKVALDARMRHDLPALAAAVGRDTGLIYVCNPNNPTGTVVAGAALREFCATVSRSTLVVVDEAYLDFIDSGATESMVDLVRADRNVVVLRTFSKIHGLAGLRVGYAVAPIGVANTLRNLAPGLVPNVAGMHAALASLDDKAFQTDTRRKILADRERVRAACDRFGLARADAQGNFFFFDAGMPAEAFRARMRNARIEVGRPFEPYRNWCRVTIGTTADTDAFLAALPAALHG
jgi:histidinol-phosphate aminotransferase